MNIRRNSALRKMPKVELHRHLMADRIVGFDLADRENTSDLVDFMELVEMTRQAGLGITVHSGEDSDASAVQKPLEV